MIVTAVCDLLMWLQTPGDGEGHRRLMCFSSQDHSWKQLSDLKTTAPTQVTPLLSLWLQGVWCLRACSGAQTCGPWTLWWTGPCLGQFSAQGILRQPACWWSGLCACLACCLAWGIPSLALTGWWGAGLGPEANKLEGRVSLPES